MSIRIRWSNLSNAIVELSRPLWFTNLGRMDGDEQFVRKECVESNKCDKSCKSCESNKTHTCTCHSARTCDCSDGDCADRDDDGDKDNGGVCPITDFNVNKPTAKCFCGFCRAYADYTEHTNTAKGKGDSPRIRFSNELGFIKQTSDDPTDSVEHSARLSTGVTL